MAWPVLIIAGAALIAGSAVGASQEEKDPSILDDEYPAPSTSEKLASDALVDIATQLYDKSYGKDADFYKKVFEGLPETKMSDSARARLTEKYKEVSLMADRNAMEYAHKAYGENLDSLVERGVLTAGNADKLKVQNEAKVRAMMSTLNKKWQATEIADARKMWMGSEKAGASTINSLATVRGKNQHLMNQAIDAGLRSSLNKAGAAQQLQTQQMWANERAILEEDAIEKDFWGKLAFPMGGMGQMGGGQGVGGGSQMGGGGKSMWEISGSNYGGGDTGAWYS